METSDPINIWLRSERPRAGRQPEHTRASIVRAALEIADEDGMEAVSIRRVASSIGSGAASLYRYVKSHDELVELMLDAISGEYELSTTKLGNASPRRVLLDLAQQGRRIMKKHPWSAPLLLSQPSLGPQSLAYLDHALAALRQTSLNAAAKLRTVAMLTAVTSAFVQNELSTVSRTTSDAAGRAVYVSKVLATGNYPALAAVMSEEQLSDNPDDVFHQIIGTYLDGAGLVDS